MSNLFCRFPSANQKNKRLGVCPLYVVGVEPTANGVSIRLARGGVADQINVAGIGEEEVMDKLEELAGDLEHSLLSHLVNPDMGKMQDHILGVLSGKMHGRIDAAVKEVKGSVRDLVTQELQTLAVADVEPAEATPGKKKK